MAKKPDSRKTRENQDKRNILTSEGEERREKGENATFCVGSDQKHSDTREIVLSNMMRRFYAVEVLIWFAARESKRSLDER